MMFFSTSAVLHAKDNLGMCIIQTRYRLDGLSEFKVAFNCAIYLNAFCFLQCSSLYVTGLKVGKNILVFNRKSPQVGLSPPLVGGGRRMVVNSMEEVERG